MSYYTTEPPGGDNECLGGLEGVDCALGIIGLVALGTMFLCLCAYICNCKSYEERQEERPSVEERRRRAVSRRPIENPVYTVRQKFPYIEIPCIKIDISLLKLFAIASFSTFICQSVGH